MNTEILAYFADLLCREDPEGEAIIDRRWITADERHDLIGDGRVVAATFVPLIAGSRDNAIAWLVRCTPGPIITSLREEARAHFMAGISVDGLRFGGLDPRDI